MEDKDFEKYIKKDNAFDTRKLLEGVELSEETIAEIDLEEILSEYGTRKIKPPVYLDEVWVNESYVPQPVYTDPAPAEPAPEGEQAPRRMPERAPSLPEEAGKGPAPGTGPLPKRDRDVPQAAPSEEPAAGYAVPLEDVMAQVVGSVLKEEEERRQVAQPVVRRGLFSRRLRREDTEPLTLAVDEEEEQEEVSYVEEEEPDEAFDDGPERSVQDAVADYHPRYKRLRKRMFAALLTGILACAFALVEHSGAAAEYLTREISTGVFAALLAVECVICFPVFTRAARQLFRRRCAPELLVSLFALVTLGDCAAVYYWPERCANLPFAPVAAMALYFTMRGEMLRLRGLRDSCHMAGYQKEPYVVTAVTGGFRKQSCGTEGFIRMADRESEQEGWYHLLLPVILTASTVFAVLAVTNQMEWDNFLWCWSAILGAASSFAFTAAFGAPLGKLARRLQRDGCAVSAYSGARMMYRKGSMILTDNDLFPPGTVFMNGMKVYAHDAIQAVSYADSLLCASGCGLRQVFDDLCRSQGGHTYPVEDFSYYQEGGIAGTIRGESVILGRSDFMAQMGVRLPREIKLQTGVFLAVDKELVAVFAVKYMASDNVDAALQAVLHNGIKPVFAVRDFNITPALIKRKFKVNTKKKCLYPDLSERLALSEREQESNGRAAALIFREGLMPYAETVIGGKRMHGAVRKGCAWALLGSICGTLMAFYLTFAGGFQVLNPLSLLVFQLLWSVPSACVNGWVTQY